MRADAYSLDSVLGEKQQWVVPVYQRHYEWETGEDKQLPKLWDDLREKALERLEDRTQFPHYFGAIIYAEPSNQAFGAVRRRFIVDGQQRITTFQLVLAATREVARNYDIERLLDVVDAYLFNEKSASMLKPERERFKLWSSSYDRSLFQNISESTPDDLRKLQPDFFYKNGKLIKGRAPNMLRAYWFLYEIIDAFISERREEGETPETVLEALLAGFLSGFQIVVIQLEENDDAQEIFASLNALGKPLSPFDLIRNDVFHRARKTAEDDERLFNEHWKTFESPFWNEHVKKGRLKRARSDHLIAYAVIAETARDVNAGKIATEYQHYARDRGFTTIAEELDVLLVHAETYRAMESPEQGAVISRIANILRIWDISTFHPLVLWINAAPLDDNEKIKLFTLIESYIIRREICGLTPKNYNKVVTGFIRHIRDHENVVERFEQHIEGLAGEASKMPSDPQVAEAFARRNVYGEITTPRLRYILQQIEHRKRTKFDETTVLTDNLTIEHVMPRKWAEHWPLPNGDIAPCESTWDLLFHSHHANEETRALMDSRQRVINTFGNLTLLTNALNPSIGNAGWEKKREGIGGSLLAINRDIATSENWSEDEIEQRAADLADVACSIWQVG